MIRARAEQCVYLGHLREDLLTVALDQAARGDDAAQGAIFLEPGDIEDILDGFFLGTLDKSAGIDHDDVRLGIVGRDLVAMICEYFQHDLGVHKILGTSERNKSDFHMIFPLVFRPPCLKGAGAERRLGDTYPSTALRSPSL